MLVKTGYYWKLARRICFGYRLFYDLLISSNLLRATCWCLCIAFINTVHLKLFWLFTFFDTICLETLGKYTITIRITLWITSSRSFEVSEFSVNLILIQRVISPQISFIYIHKEHIFFLISYSGNTLMFHFLQTLNDSIISTNDFCVGNYFRHRWLQKGW